MKRLYKYYCKRCGKTFTRPFKKRWFKSMCGDEAIVRVYLVIKKKEDV